MAAADRLSLPWRPQFRNAQASPIKMTDVQRQLNKQVVLLFFVNLALSITMTVGSAIMTSSNIVR